MLWLLVFSCPLPLAPFTGEMEMGLLGMLRGQWYSLTSNLLPLTTFQFSTFHFQLSIFNFQLSTFHFQLYKASPLRWRFKEVEAKLRIIFGIRSIFNHKSDKNARKSVHKSRLKMKRPSALTPLHGESFILNLLIEST